MGRASQDKRIFEFIKAMKETTGTHGWQFMGRTVCRMGWTLLTGVGHASLQRLLRAIQNGTTEPVGIRHNVVQARPTEASDAVDRHLYWVWHNIGKLLQRTS